LHLLLIHPTLQTVDLLQLFLVGDREVMIASLAAEQDSFLEQAAQEIEVQLAGQGFDTGVELCTLIAPG